MELANLIALIMFGVIIFLILIVNILKKLKGKISVELDKYQFSAGEKVSGNVILTLKKQVNGNQLEVSLIGQRKRSRNLGIHRKSTSYENVFDFSLPLEKEKLYLSGEKIYPFSITIPNNISTKIPELEGPAGMILKSMMSVVSPPIKWYIVAHLDASGVDLYSKKVSININ